MSASPEFSSDGADFLVWNTAFDHTINILECHGNLVSSAQSDALYTVLGSFVYTIAKPEQQRRTAFPLPCGAGKTTAVRGFIKAIHELGRFYRIVVCAEKIEALCELKRDLINEDGVSADKISLLHSYDHDPAFNFESPRDNTASEPADSDKLDDLRQFVLLSHSKLHHGYNKMPYDLLIYDESLVLGQASNLDFDELCGEIGKFIFQVTAKELRATNNQKALRHWLEQVQQSLLHSQNDSLLIFPPLPISIEEAKAADKHIHGNDDRLRTFMSWVHDRYDLRMIKEQNQGSAVITIEQTIPDHMHNIAILDASYNIRRVMQYDSTIKPMEMGANIKDQSDVTIHMAKAKAGRKSVFAGLQSGADDKLFHEVAELAAMHRRAGRNVLMFTFKDNGNWRPISRLRELIRHYLCGTDPDMLSTDGSIKFLTWGYETALNKFSHCDVVIFAGLLTLPHAAVAGRVFAHARNINLELSAEELNEVVQSEKVHSLYQALSRGSCRIMENGKARKMDAYVFSHDHLALRESLKVAMPGVKFVKYQGKHLKTKTTKKDQCKEVFHDQLNSSNEPKISTKKLFDTMPKISRDTKKDALNELLDDTLAFEWEKQGRSLVRVGVN
jgi:hypothetical protein